MKNNNLTQLPSINKNNSDQYDFALQLLNKSTMFNRLKLRNLIFELNIALEMKLFWTNIFQCMDCLLLFKNFHDFLSHGEIGLNGHITCDASPELTAYSVNANHALDIFVRECRQRLSFLNEELIISSYLDDHIFI